MATNSFTISLSTMGRREWEGLIRKKNTGRLIESGRELGVGGELDFEIALDLPGFLAELIPPGILEI